MFDSDLCCAAVSAAGMMVDIGLSGTVYHRDKERTARCYGPEATSAEILGGAVPPAPEMEELAVAIQNASRAALVAAFEPSHAASESEESMD
ncbi:hypothetical protein NADE_007742 [Nannochloris sp. 'desiccata']|nr:hypothetical protein KSW81_003483 [Chlorella desiccata (nom. nud.)]KAH7622873.1 hypothetical protein NADE_007742 [Chlorella desiccata (nom. nud.)]